MSLYTMTCLCCGAEFSNGHLKGFRCDCNQALDGDCFRCLKCTKHCTCKEGPIGFEARIAEKKAQRLQEDNK